MKEQQKNFLAVLRAAVQHTPVQLADPVDYKEILDIARQQNLLALVCEKLCETEAFTATPEYGQTIAETIGIVTGQACRTDAFLELYRKFEQASLQPVVMKGIVCRELYGEFRDHRPSGDEDLLIQRKDFPALRKVMEACGYSMERETVSERDLEVLQEITFVNPETGLHLEVHTNPIGQESGIRRKMNDYFNTAFADKCSIQIDGVKIWTMNPTDHFLFLVFHIFKHWLAEGVGIRQLIDICLFAQHYGPEIRWKYIRKSLREMSAEKFFHDLLLIGNEWFGFSFAVDCAPNCPEALLNDMMESGVFGISTQAQRTAGSMTVAAVEQGRTYRKGTSLFRAVFPGMEFMRSRFPVLVGKPWLLPVFWLVRWGCFLRHNKENGGNLAGESVKISQRRIDLMKKYGVIR